MRAFFGIEIETDQQEQLMNIASQIYGVAPKAKLTALGNYHVTVKFLGNLEGVTASDFINSSQKGSPESLSSTLIDQMTQAVEGIKPFELVLSSFGVFKKKKGDILWLGGAPNVSYEMLTRRFKLLSNEWFQTDEPEDSVLHVTLARGKALDMDLIQAISFQPITIRVNQVSFFESCRVENRLVYRPLVSVSLVK